MLVEELRLENIKCFDQVAIPMSKKGTHYNWITFLSENGGGKSTALQALALLLAGPEGAQKLLPRPEGWLRDESKAGLVSVRIRQGEHDPGQFGEERVTRSFGYSFFVTGSQPLDIRNRRYSEPSVVENPEKRLAWLRQNAFLASGQGWFGAGYGAFRRLTRSSRVIVPSLERLTRFTNFSTQFNENEPLSAFENWMVYLDYRISKNSDPAAKRRKEIGIAAVNQLLPAGVEFDSVAEDGRIGFSVEGQKVPTTGLSDGYRSVLALAGDLVWRLMESFPESVNPLAEEGVVLIDELDIHLHPIWQRHIATWLQEQFPRIQFVVATHSPLIAAGAGENALTLKFETVDGCTHIKPVDGLAFMNVERILQSEAFGVLSAYSPSTQSKIDNYDRLAQKKKKTPNEEREFEQLRLFIDEVKPFGGEPEAGSLESRIDKYLEKVL